MTSRQLYRLCILLPLSLTLTLTATGCGHEETEESLPTATAADAWLLNEGLWNANDAELSHFSTADGAMDNNAFLAANRRRLGDTGQDLLLYGSRLYVSVFGSGTIEVLDPATGLSLQQIDMGSRQPRFMAAHGGKIYVSCYSPHSLVRIDTLSLQIEATCLLSGLRPEGLCVVGDSLYVCNSFEQQSNGAMTYDSTLSIVSLATFREVGRHPVGLNPNRVQAVGPARLAVSCWGNYGTEEARIVAVDIAATGLTTTPTTVNATEMDVSNGAIYALSYDYYGTHRTQFYRIDGTTLAVSPILQDHADHFVSPYAIKIDPSTGDIYVTDSQNYRANGDLYCFRSDGHLRWKAETTTGPSRICFVGHGISAR